jgi:hypothetical protein
VNRHLKKRDDTTFPTWTSEISSDESPTVRLAGLIAVIKGCEIDQMRPLGENMDCDALDRLLSEENRPIWVTFQHEGYDITVQNSGEVEIVESIT